jgi:hypothetical protein
MPKVPSTKKNENKCFCTKCLTYLQADCPKEKTEILYCAKGKTACDLKEKGCICGACPVHEEYKLDGMYFCFRGVAK